MATDVLESADPIAPSARGGVVEWVLRVLLLVVTAGVTALALPAVIPQRSNFVHTLDDLMARRTSVVYVERLHPEQANGPVRVLWQTGRFGWYQADVPVIPSPQCNSLDMLTVFKVKVGGDTTGVLFGGQCWGTTYDEAFTLTAAAAWRQPMERPQDIDRRTLAIHHVAGIPVTSLALRAVPWFIPVAVVWVGGFVVLAVRRGRSAAGRWVWLWIPVLTVSGAALGTGVWAVGRAASVW